MKSLLAVAPWVLSLVLVVMLAGVVVAGSPLERPPSSSSLASRGTVVEKATEARTQGNEGQYFNSAPGVTAVQTDNGARGSALTIRFRLTVRDTTASPPNYDVRVNAVCHDAIKVGDPWPSTIEACR